MVHNPKLDTNEGFEMTELGPLPEEWKVISLEEVAEKFIGGGTPSTNKTEYWNGEIHWTTSRKIDGIHLEEGERKITTKGLEESSTHLIQKDNLIIGTRVGVGKVAINKVDMAISQDLTGAFIDKNKHDLEFLAYQISSDEIQNIFKECSRGTTIKGIPRDDLRKVLLKIPPLPEQRSIAFVLSTVQEAKEKTEAVIVATRALKKSLMRHLFTYGHVPLNEAEKVPLKQTEIGEVPEGWDVVRVGDVFEFSKKPKNLKIDEENEIPFIPMEYIPDEGINNCKFDLKRSEEIKSGSFFFKGDLLVAKITPSFENGKQCIVEDLPTDFGYATTEVWPIHETERTSILYLFYYLKQHEIRVDIAGKMEGSTGRQRVPKNVLENLKIPIPSLPEQQQIASILSAVDEKIEKEENKKKALDDLFKTLLHDLMTAKLRVNHLEVEA